MSGAGRLCAVLWVFRGIRAAVPGVFVGVATTTATMGSFIGVTASGTVHSCAATVTGAATSLWVCGGGVRGGGMLAG